MQIHQSYHSTGTLLFNMPLYSAQQHLQNISRTIVLYHMSSSYGGPRVPIPCVCNLALIESNRMTKHTHMRLVSIAINWIHSIAPSNCSLCPVTRTHNGKTQKKREPKNSVPSRSVCKSNQETHSLHISKRGEERRVRFMIIMPRLTSDHNLNLGRVRVIVVIEEQIDIPNHGCIE